MEVPKNILEGGTAWWTRKIAESELFDKLRPFNDVITDKKPPHPNSCYGLVLENVVIDGKECDVYHTDTEEGRTLHRIYIHIKG